MFLRVLALLLTGLTLVPSAAHLFELPGKMCGLAGCKADSDPP